MSDSLKHFRSSRTGSVIVTTAETAARMGSEWEPVGEPKKAPAKKAASSKSEK